MSSEEYQSAVLGFIFGSAATLAILALLISLAGCTTQPYREFNSDDTQDAACYAKYGGMRGYCDATEDDN